MAINKVEYDGSVLIDLTQDTVTPDTLLIGTIAHDASGQQIVGTFIPSQKVPIAYDYQPGYTSNGAWIWENSVNNHTDIYEVQENHMYTLRLGDTVGTRFRAGYAEDNPLDLTSGRIQGTQVVNQNNPKVNASVTFISAVDGYLYITKDNAGTAGLKSWLFDITAM